MCTSMQRAVYRSLEAKVHVVADEIKELVAKSQKDAAKSNEVARRIQVPPRGIVITPAE